MSDDGKLIARFASIGKPADYAYMVFRDGFSMFGKRSADPVCDWAAMYQTYGHGIVQHSGEWPVQREFMADFLASLATHLEAEPDDVEIVSRHWPVRNRLTPTRDILFLAGIKYRDDKRQWYTLRENKVSSAEKYRHDKRWNEVPEFANGSLQAVCNMMDTSYCEMLKRYAIHLHVAAVMNDHDLYASIDVDREYRTQMGTHSAFLAVNALVEAYQWKERAASSLQYYRENILKVEEKTETA